VVEISGAPPTLPFNANGEAFPRAPVARSSRIEKKEAVASAAIEFFGPKDQPRADELATRLISRAAFTRPPVQENYV